MHNPPTGSITQEAVGAVVDDKEIPDTGTLAGRLALAMELKKTNPNQVADAIGIVRQTLYAVTNGKTEKLSWPIAVKVAEHLGIRARWLQDGEPPMHPVPQLRDDEEVQLIQDYRHMSPTHQRDLIEIARRWAEEDDTSAEEDPRRPFLRNSKVPPRQ